VFILALNCRFCIEIEGSLVHARAEFNSAEEFGVIIVCHMLKAYPHVSKVNSHPLSLPLPDRFHIGKCRYTREYVAADEHRWKAASFLLYPQYFCIPDL
jgi:hypothetical protein